MRQMRPGVWELAVSAGGIRHYRTVHDTDTDTEAASALAVFAAEITGRFDDLEALVAAYLTHREGESRTMLGCTATGNCGADGSPPPSTPRSASRSSSGPSSTEGCSPAKPSPGASSTRSSTASSPLTAEMSGLRVQVPGGVPSQSPWFW
jgi:hypothetical protein